MAITPDQVRGAFEGLEDGDGATFFEHVADDVDWTVMGTHPLAGRYHTKASFMAGTYGRLTGQAGVCLATLGPGAINLSAGGSKWPTHRRP
jgi:hypothetical protein